MAFPESQILTSSDLIDIFQSTKNDQRFCFILGSGASIESGIPNGSMLEMVWMDCLMGKSGDRDSPAKKPERTRYFAEKMLAEGRLRHPFDEIVKDWEAAKKDNRSMSSEYYFDIYQLRFHPNPWSGYRYLEKIMDECKPSLGYHALALILTQNNRNNLVITTNFDSLVEDSLFWYTDKKPLVVSHEALADFIDPDVERPVIAKIHRGLMYDPFNTPETTDHLEDPWKKALDHVFRVYTPIIIGYAGADQSLMNALEKASFQKGVYWCYHAPSGPPPKSIEDFVAKQNGCLVGINGFNALMTEMGIALFGQRISPSGTLDYFQKQTKNRMDKYTEQWNYQSTQPNMEKILEPINKVEEMARNSRAENNALTFFDHFNLAYSASQNGDPNTAIAEYSKAIEKDPNRPIAYNNRGAAYARNKDYQQAIDDYTKAIELDPAYAMAYGNRALAHYILLEYDKAIQDNNIAIELDPKYAGAYRNRGNVFAALNQRPQAIDDYTKAIELDPNHANAYYNRGNSYAKLEQYERAIQDYDKAIELNPNHDNAYCNRGNVYDDLGQYKRAIKDYDKAIELIPNAADTYNNRGVSYQNLKDHKLAIKDFDKAIKLDPNYIKAYRNRAISHRALGNTALAEADEAKAAELEAADKKDKP